MIIYSQKDIPNLLRKRPILKLQRKGTYYEKLRTLFVIFPDTDGRHIYTGRLLLVNHFNGNCDRTWKFLYRLAFPAQLTGRSVYRKYYLSGNLCGILYCRDKKTVGFSGLRYFLYCRLGSICLNSFFTAIRKFRLRLGLSRRDFLSKIVQLNPPPREGFVIYFIKIWKKYLF